MKIYLTKNLWGYEKILTPPNNLPKNMKTVYITDDESKVELLYYLGWETVKIISDYKEVTDPRERRKIVSEINCFPIKYVPEIKESKFVFICDSNVSSLWNKYSEFVDLSNEDNCLYAVSGWYSGDRNNIISECKCSDVDRWGYDYKNISEATNRYINEINELNVNTKSVEVLSAKYFGWNINHPKYEEISNKFYQEYEKHIQGNIILSYLSVIYSDYCFIYSNKDYTGAIITDHNFNA